jgi:hypothetical protein
MRVYHLLSAENALSDIALHRIRISRYADLNDPFELFAANVAHPQVRDAMRRLKEELNLTKGLLCFSRLFENPVLWSHYASKHRGMCLGFDIRDDLALSIQYSDGKERIPLEFKEGDPAKGFTQQFVDRLLTTKYEHWRYEDEVRTLVQLDASTAEDGSYFYSFSDDLVLREVVLGPLCKIPLDAVYFLVRSLYADVVAVRKAELAYKWFSVVASNDPYQPSSVST